MHTLRPRIAVANLMTAKPPLKMANGFYSSRQWIELRDQVRREAGGRCQAPGCGRIETRMFVDHIQELQDGGAHLERSNAWLLCGSCHTRKSSAERARRTAKLAAGGPVRVVVPTGVKPHGAARREFFPYGQYHQERPVKA
jgi:5-methylcytosine-specific restriction protein A